MHLRPILFIVTLGVLLGLGISSTAFAQSTAEAEGLFKEGKRLMGEKKYAEACAAFEASQNKDPLPTTLVNLADCREKNGQIATAWGLFLEAERQTRGDKKQKALSKTVKERAGKLEARVSYLIINVPDESRVDGLVITRNGEPVDELTWNRALPVDGGNYLIAGKAPGHEEWTTSVTVDAEKDKQSVDVPKFKSLPVTVEDPKDPPIEDPEEKRLPDDERPAPGGGGMSGKRKAAIGIGVLGVVGLGVAGYFELDARDKYDQSLEETDDMRQNELFDDAVASRKLAIGTAIGGGLCVGVAAFLWFTGGSTSRDESDAQGLRVLPTVGPDGFGLAFSSSY
jgi:hypothetical protein